MVVYALIREDQNHYGYVDTSITGIFATKAAAHECQVSERARAIGEGLRVEEDGYEEDWQVSWKVEDHVVATALATPSTRGPRSTRS